MNTPVLSKFRHGVIMASIDGLRKLPDMSNSVLHYFPKYSQSLSDMFLARSGQFKTIFIAENPLAMTIGEAVNVKHEFYFNGSDGRHIFSHTIKTDSFMYNYELPELSEELVSFGHFTTYEKRDINKVSSIRHSTYRNNRGYTGYLRGSTLLPSFVHGNFGGLYLDCHRTLKSIARQRSLHTYLVQEIFSEHCDYELIFLNPTSKSLDITISAYDDHGEICFVSEKTIRPFGLMKFSAPKGSRIMFWSSRLPILRPLIFELPQSDNGCNVFHS